MTDFKETYEELLRENFRLKNENSELKTKAGLNSDGKNNSGGVKVSREKAFLEHLIDSIPEAIAIIDREGKIIMINREFTIFFGYQGEEARNRRIEMLSFLEKQGEDSVITI